MLDPLGGATTYSKNQMIRKLKMVGVFCGPVEWRAQPHESLRFLEKMNVFAISAKKRNTCFFHFSSCLFSCFVHVFFMFRSCFFKFRFSSRERLFLRTCSFSSGKRVFSVERRMQDRSFFIIFFQCGSDVSVRIFFVF